MLKVGLTGSIAVGKSFVCEVLRKLGCSVLDADEVSREVVEPNTNGLRKIVECFGDAVLKSDGALDRAKLGKIVFADSKKRELLNSIVHPLVIEKQNEWILEREKEDPNGIAVIDAALMIESGGFKRFDKIIVVWCEPEIQLQRLTARSGLTREQAMERIAAQMSQEEKKSHADFLIDTSDGFDSTSKRTTEVFTQLRKLAKQ
jgi:dephospho-CoA kinase